MASWLSVCAGVLIVSHRVVFRHIAVAACVVTCLRWCVCVMARLSLCVLWRGGAWCRVLGSLPPHDLPDGHPRHGRGRRGAQGPPCAAVRPSERARAWAGPQRDVPAGGRCAPVVPRSLLAGTVWTACHAAGGYCGSASGSSAAGTALCRCARAVRADGCGVERCGCGRCVCHCSRRCVHCR